VTQLPRPRAVLRPRCWGTSRADSGLRDTTSRRGRV